MSRNFEIAFGIWTCSVMAAAAAPPATITGTLVDRVRYTKENKNVANCAQDATAAKNGGPVAVITAEGEMYTVVGVYTDDNNAKLVPYMCKVVTITGETAGDTKNVRRTIMATALKPAAK
jgi:predicted MarR family transcription regulator